MQNVYDPIFIIKYIQIYIVFFYAHIEWMLIFVNEDETVTKDVSHCYQWLIQRVRMKKSEKRGHSFFTLYISIESESVK